MASSTLSATRPPVVQPRKPRWYWRREPFRTLYMISFALSIIGRMPIWLVLLTFRRPRKTWSIKRSLIIRIIREFNKLVSRCDIRLSRDMLIDPKPSSMKSSRVTYAPAFDEGRITGFVKEMAVISKTRTVRVPCFLYQRKDELAKPMAERVEATNSLILFMHGGAYAIGTAHESDLTANLSKLLVKHTGVDAVLSVDYRLVNDGAFPSALLDAITAYAHCIEGLGYSPERVIVAGDSAGGNLTQALVRYLRDEKTLPMPRAQLLFSPWTDLTLSPTKTSETNFETDILDRELGPHAVSLFFKDLPDSTRLSPYCSPGGPFDESEHYQAFAGFPPTLITNGGAERLYDEIVEAKRRYEASGTEVEYIMEPDAPHDWIIFPFLEPERTRTMKKVGAYVDALLR